MEMRELNVDKVCEILNEIIELEMAGVVRYAHSSIYGNRSKQNSLLHFTRTSK